MARRAKGFCAAAVVAMLALPSGAMAQDGCTSPAKNRECSLQCCGRTTCAPSCQGDCVRQCIDACRMPQLRSRFNSQLPNLQARCGYRSGPARMIR